MHSHLMKDLRVDGREIRTRIDQGSNRHRLGNRGAQPRELLLP